MATSQDRLDSIGSKSLRSNAMYGHPRTTSLGNNGTQRDSNVPSIYPQDEDQATHEQVVEIVTTRIGIYGWRKYCLYCSVLLFSCLAIVNIGLLVYLLRVLEVGDDHAGPLYFRSNVLSVRGDAEFTNGMVTQSLSSFNNTGLILQSNKEVLLRAANANKTSQCQVDVAGLSCLADTFSFTSSDSEQPVMVADREEAVLNARQVTVTSDSGLSVNGPIETSRLSNTHGSGRGLTLESFAQSLQVSAARDLHMQATDGDVSMSALLGVAIEAGEDITLSGAAIILENLPLIAAHAGASAYTLCSCPDGKLYRVESSATCDVAAPQLC